MALGNVYMRDTDGNIGGATPQITDKFCGLLFDISAHADFWTKGQGKNAADKLKDTVVELNSYADAAKLGIIPYTGTLDAENVSTDLLAGIPDYHIKQFFNRAGGTGRLWIAFADCSQGWEALLDMQRASGGVINQFGVWTEQTLWKNMDVAAPTYSIDIVGDIDSVMQQMANDYFAPASVILSANTSKVTTASGTDNKVVFSKIPDCIINARYVTVLLGQSMDVEIKTMQGSLESTTPVGVVGLALGCVSQASVGESIAWVQKFDLASDVAGVELGFGDSTKNGGVIKNATAYTALTKAQADELDTKGYVFLRTYEGLEGHVYFTKDRTCSNGDFCTIARNRAINKSRRLIRTSLLPFVNSPVKVNPSDGKMSAAQITVYKNIITDALTAMANAEEISGVGVVDIPAEQNILRNKKLLFSYTLIPLGCAESIEVTEGLAISR